MKGAFMNRSLLALALCLIAAPAHSMTATVATGAQPGVAPAPGTSAISNSVASKAVTTSTPSAIPASAASDKAMAPSAVSVTHPSAVLSAPRVPQKAASVASARPGVARTKANVPMPGTGPQDAGAAGATAAAASTVAPAAVVDDSAGMRRGTLQAFNVGAGTFSVYGQKLTFNAQRVAVFNRDGKPGSIFALKNGAKVRFTLDPRDPQHRRVAVIYVD